MSIKVDDKPVLAFGGVPCQECGTSSLSHGTEAKSPGDGKNFAPGQEAQGGILKSRGQEGLKAGIIGPELKK